MTLPRFPLYILDENHQPVRVQDFETWAVWTGEHLRVAHDEIGNGVRVSTIFLGLDPMGSLRRGPPLLFETMIFGGPRDHEQHHWASWDDATTNHAAIVKRLRAKLKSPSPRRSR